MTNPDGDFGDALRRALSGAADVTPADGEALRRIRDRASARTPRRKLQAALAIVIPWPAFRLLQYRTLVSDLLRSGSATLRVRLRPAGQWLVIWGGQIVTASVSLSMSGRAWLTGRGLPALAHVSSVAWSSGRSGARSAARSAGARGRPVLARVRSTVRGWTARFIPASPSAEGEGAHAPRHADSAPPVSNIGWLRPAMAAAAVAFVATLAVTVGPVRQAIVQLGSSVISDGHTQGGNGGGSLNGTAAHHTGLVPAPTSAGTVVPGSPRASAKPSAAATASCGASASASASPSSACAASSTTVPTVAATTPPASTSPSTSPTPSPSSSASPSVSPTPTNSGQAVTAPTGAAASAP
jgi:hypothetical protein